MTMALSTSDHAKYIAARRSIEFVEDGMRVGLGTGSTAVFMVRALAEMVRDEGMRIRCAATSTATATLAKEVGLDVYGLEELRWLDVTIDGADEVDPNLNLIKGGGGAHLMEKIVATASEHMVVIADASKTVSTLGAFPLPVEVIPFGWQTSAELIKELLASLDVAGQEIVQRMAGDEPFITDQGNIILDLHLERIGAPTQLAMVLNQVPGVVENGLFLDMCDTLVVGHTDGTVELHDIASGKTSHEAVDVPLADNLFQDIADG